MQKLPGVLAALSFWALAGCGIGGGGGGDDGIPGPKIVVSVTPAATTVKMEATKSFSASVTIDGVLQTGVTWSWASLDSTVASAVAPGVFKGIAGGSAIIEVTSVDPPGYHGRATLYVDQPELLSLNGGQTGSHPWSGGPWTSRDFVGGVHGICAGAGRDVYLLSGGNGLWRVNWDDPASAEHVKPMIWGEPTTLGDGRTVTIGNRISLASDSQGRIYLSADMHAASDPALLGARILRYVPATGNLEFYSDDPVTSYWSCGLAFDGQDNLYVLNAVVEAGDAMVMKVGSAAGHPVSTVLHAPYFGFGAGVTGGLAVVPDGSVLFTAIADVVDGGDMEGRVYRVNTATGAIGECSGGWHRPAGLFWTGTDLIVSDAWAGVFKVQGGSVAGQVTLFSEYPANDDKTTSVFARLNP